MAIKIGANFAYNGKLPNFDRDKFKTKAAMMAFDENNIDEGHLSYCEEDGNTYQFKSTNTVDATTGKWRPFKTEADATLNGTSINPIQNKAVFEALKLKADAAALDAYQPKYKAAFVFDKDYKYSEFQVYYGTVDLNGYTLSIDSATSVSNNFLNGTIMVETNGVDFNGNLAINCIIHSNNDAFNIRLIDTLFYNCSINHAVFSGAPEFHNCVLDYCTSGDGKPIIRNSIINFPKITGTIDFPLYNVIIDDVVYKQAIIENGKFVEAGYVSDIYASNVAASNAPSCEAVKTALQLKADKTQLNGLATKTELNGKADKAQLTNYVTTATANSTYAKKSDISNVYKFKGTKTNYADLPTTNRVTGDVWNITNADAEHGIKAGDNVAWNGTAWDNLSGTVDLSAYATTATTDAMSADITSLMNEVFVLMATASVCPNIAEVGTNPTVALTVDAKLGKGRTQVDEITIDGTKYTGTIPYTHSATATTTHTYNITVKKGAKTADASATINFYNASYYGVVDASKTSLTATEVKTLKTKEVKSGRSGTRTFNLTNQKACIAYPQSFGAATGIKDANGFDYLASYTRSEVTIDSVVYYVYLLSSPTTITDFKQIIN